MRTKRPITVTITLILILFNAFIWLAGAILQALLMYESIPANEIVDWSPVILFLGFAILWIALAVLLTNHDKAAYYVTAAIFIIEAALTIQVNLGPVGLLFLILTIAALVSLISSKRWFLQRPEDR